MLFQQHPKIGGLSKLPHPLILTFLLWGHVPIHITFHHFTPSDPFKHCDHPLPFSVYSFLGVTSSLVHSSFHLFAFSEFSLPFYLKRNQKFCWIQSCSLSYHILTLSGRFKRSLKCQNTLGNIMMKIKKVESISATLIQFPACLH